MAEFLPRDAIRQPTWSRELMLAYWSRRTQRLWSQVGALRPVAYASTPDEAGGVMRYVRMGFAGVVCIAAASAYAATGGQSAPPKNPEPLVDALFQCGHSKVDAMFE